MTQCGTKRDRSVKGESENGIEVVDARRFEFEGKRETLAWHWKNSMGT